MGVFVLPDLGEGLTEAIVVAWHVAVGDTVSVDQTVVEVETAKAVVEVPVPFAGTVDVLHAEAGRSLAVGAPLITIAEGAEAVEPPAGLAEPGVETSGAVLIGYGTGRVGGRRARVGRGAAPARRPLTRPAPTTDPTRDVPHRVAVVSPLVRRLARDAGLDLASISGSGPDGLILRRDVEASLAPRIDGPGPGDVRRIPLTGLRKVVADKLSRSRREIPEATVWVDVDATGLLAARAALNAEPGAAPISVVALLARFAILGLGRFPELNARIEGEEIVTGPAVHLGLAAQTPRGLVVPVVPSAQALSLDALSSTIRGLTETARAGTLTPAQLTGGTFTLNNYGVFGVDGSAAIINHPEVAILGIGRIIDRPWVVDGQLAVRSVGQLTLAFDHRVCDGGTAGGFLRFVADCVESPVRALRHG